MLGKGAFGVVHLVQRQGTEEVYALKQIQKRHYFNKNRMKAASSSAEPQPESLREERIPEAYNERDALSRGHGLWFVDLLCTFQDSEHIYIVMEFVQGGTWNCFVDSPFPPIM